MPTLPNQDIEFQPKTSGYSFTTEKPSSKSKRLLNTFFTLGLGFLFIFLLIAIILVLLNFFNLISLSSYLPIVTTNQLPNINTIDNLSYNQQSKTWSLSGTLAGYDDNTLQIEYKNKLIYLIYDQSSRFYIQSSKAKILTNLSDFKTPKAVNKRINATFLMNKMGNLINEITLLQ